jgi:hypothetical protein
VRRPFGIAVGLVLLGTFALLLAEVILVAMVGVGLAVAGVVVLVFLIASPSYLAQEEDGEATPEDG